MAQLKDLIVNGTSQLIGDVITNNIQITKLNAPIASNGSAYGIGSEGHVLLTNGNSIYWGTIASTSITGLAPVATSGSYNDLNNKPTLFSGNYNDLTNKPTIPAAQVQTDWNATTGISSIKNKPTLATVATSGSYNDLSNKPNLFSGDYNDLTNKPAIPAAQVQTDWDATTGMAAILHKPILAPVATSGSYNDLSNKPTDINWALKGGTEISASENLNNYIIPGNYYCTSDANAKTITNNPLGTNAQAFTLKVSCSTGISDNYLRQELQFYQHKKKYIRYCTNANNKTWSSWENTILSGDSFGNISNSGTLQTTDVTIASGDKLIITDASDSHKIARTSTVFDGATNTQTLTRKGEWASPIEYIEGLIDESTSSSWVGVTKDTSLYAGKLVAFHIPCDSVSDRCTLTLKLNNGNGNNTNALAIYENFGAENNTYFQTVYSAGTIILLAFNGSKWVVINKQQFFDLYEAKLKWGGQNFVNDFGPIDAAMIPDLGANRFAFANPAGITIEYSTDSGATWNDYGATDEDKLRLFSTGKNYYLGQHTAEGTNTLSDMLRITIDSIDAKIYTILNKIAIYMSSHGNTSQIKIEAATQGDPNTYKVFTDWEYINGWSGWNILRYIRLSFRQTALYKNPEPSAAINRILGFGGVGWVTPSEMAKTGHLYTYDQAQNVIFPAKISFKNFLDKKATFSADNLTENRVYTLPNTSGTLALAGEAPTAHMHGYIKSDGDISSSNTAQITSGDRLIINDESESKITNSSITFGTSETQVLSNKGTWVNLPTAASLGLSSALRFVGITTQTIADGSQLSPVPINGVDHTPIIGDVIISKVNGSDNEFVWIGSSWELLGRDSSFKLVQSSTVSTPEAQGSTTAFIDTISQNTNGDITVTKKNLDTSGTWSGVATTATKLSNTENIGNTNRPVYINSNGVPTPISYEVNVTVPTNAIFTDEKVKQVNQNSTNSDYRILLSGSANDNETIENVNKNTNLRFNPSTKILNIGGSINATGDLSIIGNASLTGETEINSANIGSLLVTGGTTFSQIPFSPTPANTSNDTSVATTAFVKTAISTNVVDYNSLQNKPTIPAAQVQTDWNATTGISSIKNKPTLATVATTGSYNNLSDKPNLNFLPLTGGEVTGNITLKAGANTDSPAIIFQRGTLTDDYNDWKVYDSKGYLYFGQRGSGSSDFNQSIYFDTSGNIHANLQGNASSATIANSVQAKLTIGTYEYNGSSAIEIPIYDGTIEDTLLAAEGVSF